MTNKEGTILFDEFNGLLIKVVKAYLKFDHFTDYAVRFDTGEKVKELYEIKITRVNRGKE